MTPPGDPVVEGLFTTGSEPCLIGGRRPNGSFVFPWNLGGGDPDVDSDEVEQVHLSRRGTLWSWTDTRYQPPPPYVPLTDPFEPVTIAAVELEKERMIILGPVAPPSTVQELRLGQEMELVLGPIGSNDGRALVTWYWSPVSD